MCRRSVPAWFGYHCYPKLTFHVRQRISLPPYIELIRTMKLLHSGFFFLLFNCTRVQPVHTWRINSTEMQPPRKTAFFCCRKMGSDTIFVQTDTNVSDANLFKANVKSADSNIGSKCKYEMPKGVSCRQGVPRQS